ncbi:cytochrome P450 [Aspergillus germanicus]
MCQLLRDPQGYYDHIRRDSTAVILASVFGRRGANFNSPKVRALYHVQEQFTSILDPGATPPLALYFALVEETKAPVARGAATGSFMERVLEDQPKSGLDDEHVAYLGGILMEAGSDTTASTLLSYLLGIISNPMAFERARDELNSVCGTECSPAAEDLERLPYLKACMTEILRLRPVAPGGIPHLLIQDDYYEGYHLPKGTIVFANAWSIHRERDEYSAGDEFRPERFFNSPFGTQRDGDGANDHRRTTCHMLMAKITWGFNVSAEGGETDWDVKTGYTDGFVFSQKRFPVNITARSEKHREVFEAEFQSQRDILARFKY